MILAAGRGERMRPLTDNCPKPLLRVAGKPLLVHTIEALVRAGITEIVINHAWLGQQIVDNIGDGRAFGATISYSAETQGALETAGGITHALSLLTDSSNLADEPFLVVNGDVWTDFDFRQLPQKIGSKLAHLILVKNPVHHLYGDFVLTDNKMLANSSKPDDQRWTYSGIGVFSPRMFAYHSAVKRELGPLLREKIAQGMICGELYQGQWFDIGTVERLNALEQWLSDGTLPKT